MKQPSLFQFRFKPIISAKILLNNLAIIAATQCTSAEAQGLAGASRNVNELARAYETLNVAANTLEIVFCGLGVWLILKSFSKDRSSKNYDADSTPIKVDWRLVCWGVSLILVGLTTPGTLSWFWASSRDMSYFSSLESYCSIS